MPRKTIIFVVLVSVFAVMAAVAVYLTLPKTTKQAGLGDPNEPALTLPPPHPVDVGRATEEIKRAMKASPRLTNLKPDDVAQVSRRSAELLGLYDGGTLDGFTAWIEAQGLPKSDWLSKGKADEQFQWDRSQAMTSTGQYDLADAKVFYRMVKGRPGEKFRADAGFVVWQRVPANRAATGDDIDLSDPSTDLIEIVVPTVFVAKDGKPFKSNLGMMFGRNDKVNRWVIVAATVYGFPPGKVPAPLRV